MTRLIRSAQSTTAEQADDLVTEIFQAATIALVGVLGLLTVAVSF